MAIQHLLKNRYRLLQRNFTSAFGEIDAVAIEGDQLVLIEVKTRWSQSYGSPEEAITHWKLERIIKTGHYFRLLHPELPDSLRIDLVAVEMTAVGQLKEIRIHKNITS